MKIVFFLLFAAAAAFADNLPGFDEDGDAVVERLVTAVRETYGRNSNVERAVIAEVMTRNKPYRERGEVLALYHSILRRITEWHKEAGGFHQRTSEVYGRFKPSFAELRAGVLAAGNQTTLGNELTENQSIFFLRHLESCAPEHAKPVIELFKQFPESFPHEVRLKIWSQTLPQLIEPPTKDARRYFLGVYDSILASYVGRPEELGEFVQRTRGLYRAQKPTVSEMVASAKAIGIPGLYVGQKIGGSEVRSVTAGFEKHPIAPIRFLLAQIEGTPHDAQGLIEAGELAGAVRDQVNGAHRWRGFGVNMKYHWEPQVFLYQEEFAALDKAGDQAFFKLLDRYEPRPGEKEFAQTTKRLDDIVMKRGGGADVRHHLVEGALRAARNHDDFRLLFDHLKKSAAANQRDAIADERFGDFLSWNPPLETLSEIYGEARATEAQMRQIEKPAQFLTLFKDALAHDLWVGPRQLSAFLEATLPRFYAAHPSADERQQMLDVLRDRPIPWAQKLAILEAHGNESGGDIDALRKELARLATGQLLVEGEDPATISAEARAKRRRAAVELLAHHRAALYPDASDEKLVAAVVRDAGVTPPFRFLAELSDDLKNVEADHVIHETMGRIPIDHADLSFEEAMKILERVPKGDADAEQARRGRFHEIFVKNRDKEPAAFAAARKRFAPTVTDDVEFVTSMLREMWKAGRLVPAEAMNRALALPPHDSVVALIRELDREKPVLADADQFRVIASLGGPSPGERAESRGRLVALAGLPHGQSALAAETWSAEVTAAMSVAFPEAETSKARLASLLRELTGAPPPALVAKISGGEPDVAAALILRDAKKVDGDVINKVGGRELVAAKKCGPSLWQRMFGGK